MHRRYYKAMMYHVSVFDTYFFDCVAERVVRCFIFQLRLPELSLKRTHTCLLSASSVRTWIFRDRTECLMQDMTDLGEKEFHVVREGMSPRIDQIIFFFQPGFSRNQNSTFLFCADLLNQP